MTKQDMIKLVKDNIGIEINDIMISDVITNSLVYCNIKDIPDDMEPFIRKKVNMIMDYESTSKGAVFGVTSIKEGDTSISYNTNNISRETVYGLSDSDKKELKAFRRTRR